MFCAMAANESTTLPGIESFFMTVLAHVWTPDGFVVGADGRGQTETGDIQRDDLKKLIRLNGPGVNLICGWTGATRIPRENGPFDLSKETENIGSFLSDERLGEQYIERFAEKLRRHFTDEIETAFMRHPTSALFVGYVENRARYWVWTLGADSKPEKKYLMERVCRVLSGDDDCKYLLSIAHNLEEGGDRLRCYIECCKANSCKYGGETQILTVPRPP
jgi:hypothetical protein